MIYIKYLIISNILTNFFLEFFK